MKWRLRTLHVVAVGESVALETRDRLAAALARKFDFSCRFAPEPLSCAEAFDPARNQYYSTQLLERLGRFASGADSRVLGLACVDLFVPVLTFVFGEAQLHGNCALVSSHRLREEFYGLPPRPDLLEQRLLKEAVHEIGHTFGLRHCDDWQCVMTSSHSVERLDVKSSDFCAACRSVISAAAA